MFSSAPSSTSFARQHPGESDSIELNVQGMTCSNCALSIERLLQREGMQDVQVSFTEEEVRFRMPENTDLERIIDGIEHIGFHVVSERSAEKSIDGSVFRVFLFCAILTAPLLLGMFLPVRLLHNPWVQFGLSLPVFLVGLRHFGPGAWNSLKSAMPNMDVLILLGASAAFLYSLTGLLLQLGPDYLFFETAATIITLVLLGNWIEQRAVRQTTSAIRSLVQLQSGQVRVLANPETTDSNLFAGKDKNRLSTQENSTWKSADQVRVGEVLLVEEGEKILLDGILLSGAGEVDESMLTGESLPVSKQPGDRLLGGSQLRSGLLMLRVTATGRDTVLSGIIQLVREASADKPPIQRLADRISAWFVPIVVGIALLTFVLGVLGWDLPVRQALLQAIAVLVISCPCAMGLATPTALSVGLGKAAGQGILIKGASTLERLESVRRIVFDKTGTLTTGEFSIKQFERLSTNDSVPELEEKLAALTRHSNHPVSRSICKQLPPPSKEFSFAGIREVRGMGIEGSDARGDVWQLGSPRWFDSPPADIPQSADLVFARNGLPLAWLQIEDTLHSGSPELIRFLHSRGIETILLSGDRREKVQATAEKLGMNRWYAGKLPSEKLELIRELQREKPLAMVGDGINDAPSLAAAEVGIALVDSTRAARQAAGIVLLGGRPDQLVQAINLANATVRTIRQNLFWAFFYNVLAIPIAAVGLLSPMIAAGAMAFSDLVVVGNSLLLKFRSLVPAGKNNP